MHEILARLGPYRALHRKYPFYVAESLDKIGGALLCCLAVYLLHRSGFSAVFRELGLAASVLRGISFAVVASSPMLVGFALTRSIPPGLGAPNLLFLAVFSPIVEELEFRGFGFWQLYRRARWPLWLAITPARYPFRIRTHRERARLERNGEHFSSNGDRRRCFFVATQGMAEPLDPDRIAHLHELVVGNLQGGKNGHRRMVSLCIADGERFVGYCPHPSCKVAGLAARCIAGLAVIDGHRGPLQDPRPRRITPSKTKRTCKIDFLQLPRN
jgi:hypothetical protein